MKKINWKQILSVIMAVLTVLTGVVSPVRVYAAKEEVSYPPYSISENVATQETERELNGGLYTISGNDISVSGNDITVSGNNGSVSDNDAGQLESEEMFVLYNADITSRSAGPVKLEVGKKVGYPGNLGKYSTHYFYVNGKIAYCLESMKGNPASGDYAAEILEGNSNLQKALYYGYGGPEDLTDRYMPHFDQDLKFVFTHLTASYFYCGMDAFHGCSMEDIIDCGVMGYIEFLASQKEPLNPELRLSTNSLKASFNGTEQITEQVTLYGDIRNYVALNVPEGITYHNCNTGATITGDIAYIYGGTPFYFTASPSVTVDWNSGELRGNAKTVWKALVVKTAEGKQDVGSYYEEAYSSSVSFSVDWMEERAKIGVSKVDSKEGNAKLAGAVFGIYRDKECTQLITEMPATDTNGYAEAEIVKTQDTVYLKEITAPKGYRINTTA